MKTNTNRRVALITGANRGIGLQTAKDLGPDGVSLLLGVRDLAKGKAAAETMRQEAFEAEAVHLDVTDPGTYEKVYDFIDRVFGRLEASPSAYDAPYYGIVRYIMPVRTRTTTYEQHQQGTNRCSA